MIKIKIGDMMCEIDNVEELMRDSGLSDIEITFVKYVALKFQYTSSDCHDLSITEQEFVKAITLDRENTDIEDILDQIGRGRVKIRKKGWYPLYSYIGFDDKGIHININSAIKDLLLSFVKEDSRSKYNSKRPTRAVNLPLAEVELSHSTRKMLEDNRRFLRKMENQKRNCLKWFIE